MADRRRHRGPHPEDHQLFAPCQVPALQTATADLSWLLDRGYAEPSSLKLVGDRYTLTARQRLAVARCAAGSEQCRRRDERKVAPESLGGEELWIDGYNVLTSIEAALSGGVLIRGRDGCLRDMASMHGSYRKVDETVPAIALLGEYLARWDLCGCRWLLDQPVSNSGRLRALLRAISGEHGWNWTVDLVPDPDPLLVAAACCVATADSGILDVAGRWMNLVDEVVRNGIAGAWIVDLSPRHRTDKSDFSLLFSSDN